MCLARWDTICVICHNGIVHSHQLCSVENAFTCTLCPKKIVPFAAFAAVTRDLLMRVWTEMDYRLDICRVTKGAHIESL